MRTRRFAVPCVGAGATGGALIAIDDLLRFWVSSLLPGSLYSTVAAVSMALLALGCGLSWRWDRVTFFIGLVVLMQLVGRSMVSSTEDSLWWAVNGAHLVAPFAAIVAGSMVARRSKDGASRWLGWIACGAAGVWLATSWLPEAPELLVGARALSVVAFAVLLWRPVGLAIAAGMRHLWASAEVR